MRYLIYPTVNQDVEKLLKKDLGIEWEVRWRFPKRNNWVPSKTATRNIQYQMGQAILHKFMPNVHHCVVECGNVKFQEQSKQKILEELLFTCLHEYRHFHQRETWDPLKWAADQLVDYASRPSEKDANEWAKENLKKYKGLLSIRFKTNSSPLGRLAKMEQKAGR